MSHPGAAEKFNRDTAYVHFHDTTLWRSRVNRDRSAHEIPEWETLRQLASDIKEHTLSRLDEYLVQFEKQAQANGVMIHWAADAEEHNQIVYDILKDHGTKLVVKSKSMLTEECHLNPYLESKGIEVVDTDLGERIVQFAGKPPSHIVAPAVHMRREEISDLFHEHLGTEKGEVDPEFLTGVARKHLREKFLNADAAITGANFLVAETGGFVVTTNEGNADMGVHLAPVHIACVGIEKLIPRLSDLGVYLRLLARSALGQPITIYSSHFRTPAPGQELHVVLVDNGRSAHLGRTDYYKALKCIRCGACLNTCPVYRRSGGYSYEYTLPGPIGSILAPGRELDKHSSLPFASSLCGSCSDVCPVKIDIHQQLYKWRQVVVKEGKVSLSKRFVMGWMGRVLSRPGLYKGMGKFMRWSMRKLPRWILYNKMNVWGRRRELPVAPGETFRDWYKKNR